MSHTYHRYKVGDEPVAGYRLMSHLGAGGFGEVWKATAPGGTEVAIKIIDLTGQQGVQEFSSLRVVKKVRHPNLISLQAFWMKDEEGQIVDEVGEASAAGLQATTFLPDSKQPAAATSNIAMTTRFARPVELIIAMQLGSMSLHKRLEDCREQGLPGVPVAELLEYLEQAARGIDFLNKPIHDLGKGPVPIVHGDVKPHNILVVGDAAVVCDFGLARAVETLRKTSMAPVTVAYAAPESFKGKVTPTSDQYSLAITYAELRTGRLPFDETMTPYQVMEAHVTRNLDFNRLPEPERLVVLRATEGNPEDRWPSSRDMILALRYAAAQTGELPLRPGESAFSGGPTPSHSLTARPQLRGTDLPTRHPVDPSRETAHPGGHTPSEMFSLRTAPSPYETMRPGESLSAEALAAQGLAPKKSALPKVAMIGVAAAFVVAGALIVPKLINNQTVANVGGASHPQGTNSIASDQKNADGSNVDKEVESSDPNVQYIQAVSKEINGGNFNKVVELLDKAPSKLPGYEKENLQKRLRMAFISYIDSLCERQKFVQALAELEDASSGLGLTPEDRQSSREKIRTTWLTQAQAELQNGQPPRALDMARNLLKQFDKDRDAQFLIVRCQLQQGDYAAALSGLNVQGKTADLPPEYQPLHAGLLLLATGLQANTPAEWVKVLDEFLAYTALEKSTAPPPALALNAWERSRIDGLRTQVSDNAQQLLATLPADQATALAAKLSQLGSSAELGLFQVKSALESKHFDEARKTLKAVAEKLPADSQLKSEVAAMGLLIELRDPTTKPADAAKAIADCAPLIGKITPSLRAILCEAAATIALNSQGALLDAAIKLTTAARDLDPVDKPMQQQLAQLLAARLEKRAASTDPPPAKELPQILQDCQQVEELKLASGTVDAFHAECLLAQNSSDRQQLTALVERAKPVDPYVEFVRARVLSTASKPDWLQIAKLLTSAYSDPAKPDALIAPPYRRAEAAKLLIQAAASRRNSSAPTAATILSNPFGDSKTAAEAFQWLRTARLLSEDIEKLELKKHKPLWVNWSLAAVWKTKAETFAQGQLSRLSQMTNAELGDDAFPILYATFKTHGTEPTEQAAAVQIAERMISLFQEKFPSADPQAIGLYSEIVQPALVMADTLAASKQPPADLDKFYSAVAEYIYHYKRVPKWPFADKQAEIEKLTSEAIKLNPKVAKYYTTRGVARISLTPPNVDGALADAAAAAKLDTNLPAAYALQGHALIYRSRQEATSTARKADLEKAIAQCQVAVEKSKPDAKDRSMHLLYLSMAQLESANFETDPKVKKQLLEQAVVNARQAVDLEKAYPDYAYTALGNALEDVAWLVGDEPEKNYQAAINAFSQAISDNPAAETPLVSRARCYYRAIADSKLDPKVLGGTLEEDMQAAVADLQQAKQLNPNSVETDLWLGKSEQLLGQFAEADTALGDAVKLADEQKLPERALFLLEWARNAKLNTTLSDADRLQAVRDRAEQLKAAPNLGGSSSAKEAAVLIGETYMSEKPPKLAEALKEYDAALADYDKADPTKPLDPTKADGSDVSLLLARAACELNPASSWNLTTAESLLKDMQRVARLKPGPHLEAAADWYSANAKSRSAISSSPTFTPAKKKEFSDGAIDDIRKAIDLAPDDPGSWEWRAMGAKLMGVKITLLPANTPAETIKKLGTEARRWIDEAVDQAGKRPDLAGNLDALTRIQQDLDGVLTKKGLPRM
jgi:serine/threonine protein kinase